MVEVSAGELLDRISILQIKVQRLPPEQARVAARALTSAVEAKSPVLSSMSGLEELSARLLEVNLALWAAEDELRDLQREERFGATFVEVARSVCENNDLRAALKQEIDRLVGSEVGEQKSYPLPAV